MPDALVASIVPGLGLGGVLAAVGAWSRAARTGKVPHLAVGAFAGLGVAVALRLQGHHAAFVVLVVAAVAGAAGALAAVAERVLTRPRAPAARMPGLADLAVLGAVASAATLMVPATAVPLPFGPLGGSPGAVGGVAALVLGVALAVAATRASDRRGGIPVALGVLLAAGVGVTATLAAGAMAVASPTMGVLVGLPDTAGLALRGAAAALAGRRGPADAAAAGLGLGLLEPLLRVVDPLGGTSLLPAAAVAVLGLVMKPVTDPRPRARRRRSDVAGDVRREMRA